MAIPSIPDAEELATLQAAAGDDPDKLAKLETYVSLLAALDERLDEGDDVAQLTSLSQQISAARRDLDVLL